MRTIDQSFSRKEKIIRIHMQTWIVAATATQRMNKKQENLDPYLKLSKDKNNKHQNRQQQKTHTEKPKK